MSTDPADKEYWITIMIKWAKEITAISVPSNVVTSCVSQPRSTPSALVTVRATASSARLPVLCPRVNLIHKATSSVVAISSSTRIISKTITAHLIPIPTHLVQETKFQ